MASHTEESAPTGPIAWMARNPVAANLLMVLVIVGGVLALTRIKQEVFPEFDLDVIQVQVPYPGASPAEVEQGIVLAVEEEVRGVDGVKRVTSTSAEGFGTVNIELLLGEDTDRVLADVKTAVDRITSFPEEAENLTVQSLAISVEVISLVISGQQEPQTLQALGEVARERMLDHPDITKVELFGVRPLEVSIEVSRENLESYGLTLDQVAQQISAASLELPGGGVDTRAGEILVRVADRKLGRVDFEELVIRSTLDGASLRLGDIATVEDGYADTDQATYFNGRPAVRVTAYRVGAETPMSVADATREVMEDLRDELPAEITLSVWADDSENLRGRIALLVDNAKYGLFLVVLILALFLNLRLAFWVSLGIPFSFLGAILFLPSADVSINMISLFAFIVTLGLVVDDAIVIGENIFAKRKSGMEPMQAAIEGAREMVKPVGFAVLTSMAAFAPMLFVPGVFGKVFRLFPAVIILVLIFSLIESFFVLPAHLSHEREPREWRGWLAWIGSLRRGIERAQAVVARGLRFNIDHLFTPTLKLVMTYRYMAISVGVALFLISVGIVAAGILPRTFFPSIEGDLVSAAARLPYGVSMDRTLAVQRALEQGARGAIEEFGGDAIVRGTMTRVGEGPLLQGGNRSVGSHLVTVDVSLIPSEDREFSSEAFQAAWRARTPEVVGLEALVFTATTGPGAGAAVDVRLAHRDTAVLAEASAEIGDALSSYPALSDINNSYAAGKPQLDFRITEQGRVQGLTSFDIARQIRSSYFGAESLREQRGRNEVKVMVRLPEDQRDSLYHLEEARVRTPGGGFIPLAYVADVESSRAPTEIVREDGQRVINVTAELVPGQRSSTEIKSSLTEEVFPALAVKYPGLEVELSGSQRDEMESMAALGQGYLVALLVIFGLLAIPFRSYTQPLIIMSAIPFGFIGAVAGHLIMGYELSFISAFGIIALSGVVVNDSLVLIDRINRERAAGASVREAVVMAGRNRFRPILLTSLTTFFGLMPMILEQSLQARFLVPMAISLGFGLLFSTFVILLIVPALYLVLEDVTALLSRRPSASDDERPRHEMLEQDAAADEPPPITPRRTRAAS